MPPRRSRKTAMRCDRIVFSGHPARRLFERAIGANEVAKILRHGEVIDDYPDDIPYPSCLVLGYVEDRPIHIVVAIDAETRICHVVTVYSPDPKLWENGFRRRRSS